MANGTYEPGGFYRICDRCGFQRRHYETAREWTGLIVCKDACFEHRHPQDGVRGRRDRIAVPNPRPEPEPVFLDTNDVQPDDL